MKRRMPKRAWSSGRGALTLVALLLVSSAALRLSGAGAAIAKEVKEQLVDVAETAPLEHDPASSDLAPDLVRLLKETKAREQLIMNQVECVGIKSISIQYFNNSFKST